MSSVVAIFSIVLFYFDVEMKSLFCALCHSLLNYNMC
jgi:hypothetical protein